MPQKSSTPEPIQSFRPSNWTALLERIDALIAEHAAAHERAKARAKKAPASRDKPGHPDYSPLRDAEQRAINECRMDASFKGDTLIELRNVELAPFLALLMGKPLNSSREDIGAWFAENEKPLSGCVQGFKSHSSKLFNTQSSTGVSVFPEKRRVPYLCSATIESPVRQSFFGDAKLLPFSKVMGTPFILDGNATTLLQGLTESAPWLSDTGLTTELAASLGALARKAGTSSPADLVPQLFWPSDGDYLLLSPLPCVEVLDALKTAHQDHVLKESLPGRYLPTKTLTIGGANPRNGGALNQACKDFEIFHARVPTLPGSVTSTFARRITSKQWLNRPSRDELRALSLDLEIWTNQARETYVRRQAEGLVASMLTFAVAATEAISTDRIEVPPFLGKRLAANVAYKRTLNPHDRQLARGLAVEMLALCIKHSKELARFPARQRDLMESVVVALLPKKDAQ